MTDWTPWAFVMMVGTFVTFWSLLRDVSQTPAGDTLDLRVTKLFFWATVVLSVGVFSLYLLFGEGWLWY